MKTLCFVLILSLLIAGCYSQQEITKDEPIPGEESAVFYLHDGSHVYAEPGGHSRVEGGFLVTGGTHVVRSDHIKFDGVVPDTAIVKMTTNRFSPGKTALAAVGGACVVALIVGIIYFNNHPLLGSWKWE